MTLQELERTWRNEKPESGRLQEKIWDERAEDFAAKPLPGKETHPFLRYLYEKVPLDKTMSVLDIGCGAGQLSLALAGKVREAVGTDVSGKMAEAAGRLAEWERIRNVKFFQQDWQAADLDVLGFRGRFELVFAHMTPAVADYETLDKMNACAKEHCILVKPARRSDAVQDAAFAQAGIFSQKEQLDDAIANTFTYLWLKGYEPELSYRKEEWKSERSLESMKKWCVDRAKLQKELTGAEEEAICRYLEGISRDGQIEDRTLTTIVTIYWNVKDR